MTTRYINWQHCTSNDNTVHPLTALYFQRQHGTSTDSTVHPMTTRYIHCQHCTSNDNTVHPLTTLYFQWQHGTSTDSTVLPITRRYSHWQYSTALTARHMQSMSIPCILISNFHVLSPAWPKKTWYILEIFNSWWLSMWWLTAQLTPLVCYLFVKVSQSFGELRGYVECAVTKRKAVINLFVCSSV